MPEKTRLLTLKVDSLTLAEFAAAATIFRARSVSSFLHQYVVGQINEARKMVPPEEFERLVEEHMRATEARSKLRSALAEEYKIITPPPPIRNINMGTKEDADQADATNKKTG